MSKDRNSIDSFIQVYKPPQESSDYSIDYREDAAKGFVFGMAMGVAALFAVEPNSELVSLTLESLLPGSAMAAYSAGKPMWSAEETSFTRTAVRTGATMAGYIITRVIYS